MTVAACFLAGTVEIHFVGIEKYDESGIRIEVFSRKDPSTNSYPDRLAWLVLPLDEVKHLSAYLREFLASVARPSRFMTAEDIGVSL